MPQIESQYSSTHQLPTSYEDLKDLNDKINVEIDEINRIRKSRGQLPLQLSEQTPINELSLHVKYRMTLFEPKSIRILVSEERLIARRSLFKFYENLYYNDALLSRKLLQEHNRRIQDQKRLDKVKKLLLELPRFVQHDDCPLPEAFRPMASEWMLNYTADNLSSKEKNNFAPITIVEHESQKMEGASVNNPSDAHHISASKVPTEHYQTKFRLRLLRNRRPRNFHSCMQFIRDLDFPLFFSEFSEREKILYKGIRKKFRKQAHNTMVFDVPLSCSDVVFHHLLGILGSPYFQILTVVREFYRKFMVEGEPLEPIIHSYFLYLVRQEFLLRMETKRKIYSLESLALFKICDSGGGSNSHCLNA